MEPAAAPLAPDERITPIDILRGIALLGVLMVNLTKAFRVSIFAQFLPSETSSPGDRWLEAFITNAFEMKAFALFSLLFGIGLAIQYERLTARGRALYWLARRLLILLAFGLIHLLLIWNGDILTEYAAAGLLVLPMLGLAQKSLATTALGLLMLYVLMPLMHLPIYWPDEATLASMVDAANRVYAHGSLAQVMGFSLGELKVILPLHLFVFPRTLGLFLLGVVLWRARIPQQLRRYQRGLLFVGTVFLAAGLALTLGFSPEDFASYPTLGACLNNLAPILQALGYAALVGCAVGYSWPVRFFRLFAPLGRMAFSNYILQSLVFCWIFFGYGLGWFAHMSVTAAFSVGVSVYVLQMIGSALWLQHFRFGPLEWLWRSLMYGRSQPMRKLPQAA